MAGLTGPSGQQSLQWKQKSGNWCRLICTEFLAWLDHLVALPACLVHLHKIAHAQLNKSNSVLVYFYDISMVEYGRKRNNEDNSNSNSNCSNNINNSRCSMNIVQHWQHTKRCRAEALTSLAPALLLNQVASTTNPNDQNSPHLSTLQCAALQLRLWYSS